MGWDELSVRMPEPRLEPSRRWVRVRAGGVTVADSRRAVLLAWYGPGRLPTYLLPPEDVRTDLLRPSAPGAALPRDMTTGDTGFLRHDVVTDAGAVEGAALLAQGLEGPLAAGNGWWTFCWDPRLVTWTEEAMEVVVHARDTTKRVDAIPSERHVRVSVGGVVLADSRRPVALFETALPPRWYLPPEDVRLDLLEPSDLHTTCPYKGTASYWSYPAAGDAGRDLAWSYPDPIPELPRVKGLIAFFDERVDLEIDGVPQPRPVTPWSR